MKVSDFLSSIAMKLKTILAIPAGESALDSLHVIRDSVEIRGSNFWILFCGAMLASLGLDVNSAAVIIGAMLVSPLMSPILGIGVGIGVNDKPFLMLSLKNFGIAVFLSLLTSFIYFLISPLGVPTSEIMARTSPTLLDAAIAFFGGMAGMIANSRKGGSNAIPGVAIATALMPPLCSSGFGLATGNYAIFMGAFYLFFINAVIISISTYIVCRMLQLPYVQLVDELTRKRVHRWISVFVIIVIIPSVFILYFVIRDANINQKITGFIKENIKNDNRAALQWESVELDSITLVKIYIVGENIKSEKLTEINREFSGLGLTDYRLKLIHMNMTEEERKQLTSQAALDVLKAMQIKEAMENQRMSETDSLRKTFSLVREDSLLITGINSELKALFPEISDIAFTKQLFAPGDSAESNFPVFIIEYRDNTPLSRKNYLMPKLNSYFKSRLRSDSLKILQL